MRLEIPKPKWNKYCEFFRSYYSDEDDGEYPIQCLPHAFSMEDGTYICNEKAVPFIHLFAQLAIEFNLFDDKHRRWTFNWRRQRRKCFRISDKSIHKISLQVWSATRWSYILDTNDPFATVGSVNETGCTKISMDPQLRRLPLWLFPER